MPNGGPGNGKTLDGLVEQEFVNYSRLFLYDSSENRMSTAPVVTPYRTKLFINNGEFYFTIVECSGCNLKFRLALARYCFEIIHGIRFCI